MKATSARRAWPQRRRRQETRRRLMEAALSVFARQGYDGATIDEIVREAGYSKGALYVHFQGKEDLFWEMLDERIARQQEAFRQALDFSLPLAETVSLVLERMFLLMKEDSVWASLSMEFGAHAMRNERVRRRLVEMYRRWRHVLVESIEEGKRAGRVRPELDAQLAASLLMAVVEGSVIQSWVAPEIVRLEELRETLARTLAQWLGRK